MGEPYDAEAAALVAGQCNCGRPDGRLGWGSKHNDRCPAYHLEDNEDEIAAALRRAHEAGRRERDDALRSRAEAAEAEAERLRHGLDDPRGPVEGDFVCPNGLALANLRQALLDIHYRMRREARAKDGTGHTVIGGGMLLYFAGEIEGLLDREGTR